MTEFISTSLHRILSVSDLNRLAKQTLETAFPLFWISGEISNFTRAASGHWYFSLKDAHAQVRCVMFKGRNAFVDFVPREGDHIEARALVTLYEARGEFQLTLEFMQAAGLGRLYEAFEQLKQRLQAEGLFDNRHKKNLPQHPRCIGVVTSTEAAALQDVLSAIHRRHAGMRVIIYPTAVQGKTAAAQIALAIHVASQRNEVDVLLICRGGGSLEDLWSFNEEVVARAIYHCGIPTVSGVGHESDVTIADFVADVRAATPTAAAELACPDQTALHQQLVYWQQRLQQQMQRQLQQYAQTLDYLARRCLSPSQQCAQQKMQLDQWQQRLQLAMRFLLQSKHHQLVQVANSLQQLNPQHVLARGYAIVRKQDGSLVSSQQQLKLHENLRLTLHQGEVMVTVNALDAQSSHPSNLPPSDR